ncbi:hypothetical protein SAMN05518849_12461 [Sphingobium sp. AP50]|nr:hypothetical protein SAMN05518849_12461 [Sphingobium sp. AP50]
MITALYPTLVVLARGLLAATMIFVSVEDRLKN